MHPSDADRRASRPAAVKATDYRLATLGALERQAHPTDRNVKALVLTPKASTYAISSGTTSSPTPDRSARSTIPQRDPRRAVLRYRNT